MALNTKGEFAEILPRRVSKINRTLMFVIVLLCIRQKITANLLISGKFYVISPIYLGFFPYIMILWVKHGKYQVLFFMSGLYINQKWKIRGDEDNTIAQLKDDTFEIIPIKDD